MSAAPSSREAGFTLVELLVSLAILALVAGLIFQALGAHRRALSAIERRTEAGEEVAWAQDEIRFNIQQLFAHATFIGAAPVLEFSGGPDSVEFVTLARDGGSTPRLRRVRLDLSPAGDLELASASPEGLARYGAPRILLRDARALRLSYFGAGPPIPGAPATPSWQSRWTNAASPPSLVRVLVGFDARDGRFWPELLARPAATVDDACVLDPQTGTCRGRG